MKKVNIISLLFLLCSQVVFGQIDEVTISLNDSTDLILERARFQSTGKEIEYYDNKFPYSINGRPIFGTDGGLPKYILIRATLKIRQTRYDLEVGNMYEPWFGDRPNDDLYKLKYDGTEIRLTGLFSDGAGSYGAEWLIVGKSSIRTILTRDEWILFEYFEGEK